jgi:hypothetical protein
MMMPSFALIVMMTVAAISATFGLKGRLDL